MNKYKMISICSFTIVCVLIMSLLLPVKTIANDKESLEISMKYSQSKVTLDISVNSEVYTGVVCKYLMVDNVLVEEDILSKTKEKGTTINLDKNNNDKYTTEIKDVNKRYVVVYVTIGNCELCDWIDCKPDEDNQEENKQEQPAEDKKEENKQEQPAEDKKEENKQEQPAEDKKEENKQEQPAEDKKEENKQEKPAEDKKEENKQEQPAEDKKEENKQEKPAEDKKEENKQEQPAESKKEENKTEQKPSNNNNSNGSSQATSNDKISANGVDLGKYEQNTPASSNTNKPTSGDKDSINVNTSTSGNKDDVNADDFQEIEKVSSTGTVDGNMPKTGEDDFVKILGIVVFSVLSVVSFYKYQKTK